MARTNKVEIVEQKREERTQALALLSIPSDGWDEANNGHEPYIKRDKRGRPTVMTKQTLQKLEMAYRIGCPDREACIFAGIALQTLYNYCKENPDFLEQKEEWKDEPILIARANVVGSMKKGSVEDSWRYLQKKRKKEFADMKIEAEAEMITAKELEDLERGEVEVID